MEIREDFSGEFYKWQGINEVELPVGWFIWFRPYEGSGKYHRPECKPETYRVAHGWKAFTTYSTHQFALGRQIQVKPGALIHFSARALAWSSKGDNIAKSEEGSYRHRIGVDPFGGTDPNSPDVVWDAPAPGMKVMDTWVDHVVDAAAQATRVTIWIWGDAEWPLKHNDLYVDDVEVIVSQAEPTGDLESRVADLEAMFLNFDCVEAFGRKFVVIKQ